MSSLRRDIRAHSANYDCSKLILISFSRSLLVPHDILIYCPNFLVLGMQSGQMNYFKAFILRGFFLQCYKYYFPLSIYFLYIYIYIYNCRQYCFGLLGLISAVLMSRMEVKLKKPPQMSHTCGTSKPCQSEHIYIYIYIYSLTSQNSYNDLPTKLLGALFVKVFH